MNNGWSESSRLRWQLLCEVTASQTHFHAPPTPSSPSPPRPTPIPPSLTRTHSRSLSLLFCCRATKLFRLSSGIRGHALWSGSLRRGARVMGLLSSGPEALCPAAACTLLAGSLLSAPPHVHALQRSCGIPTGQRHNFC